MTAPEQPAGGPEPSSPSPSEPVTQEPSTTHVEAKTTDAAPPADASVAKDALPTLKTSTAAERKTSPTENTPSDAAHVAESTPETPAPTTPPAQTGSKMSQQLAAVAIFTKQKEQVTADAREETDSMSASAITIRPPKAHDADFSVQYLSPEPSSYVDPTPATPVTSQPTSRSPSNAARSHRSDSASPGRTGADGEDKRYSSEEEHDGGSRSEIQSIMEQFSEHGGGPDADEVMSPRLEITSPMFGGPAQHPPRKSSLEPLSTKTTTPQIQVSDAPGTSMSTKDRETVDDQGPPVPPKDGSFGTPPRKKEARGSTSLISPKSPQLSMHRPPPPQPEPEPALPFDFYRFLEQLRNKRADPVARYLKSFLNEFSKRQWMVHEQVKIISDFLAFIANKMMLCEVWRDVSDAEFDNAREGMEKLVMNRLYTKTFSPAIPPPKPVPGARPKRRGAEVPLGSGRRGQHQEDVERDDIVSQKINIYGWIKPEHLDIPAIEESGRRFLKLAQQELLKIKSYRAPRDKIICVLNCCKVIFGLLKHNKSDSSADSFMPLLIYVVLQSNPEHLVSNLQYILRFRNQDRLGGEAGYYLSSLMGAVQFVENMDRTSLTISDEEFEKSVEAAVSAIAERNQALSPTIRQQATFSEKPSWGDGAVGGAGASSPPSSARPSYDGEAESSEGAAISGLLRTFQRPLTTIGRMFSDEPPTSSPSSSSRPHHHPPPRSSQDGGSRPRTSTEEPPLRPSARTQTQKQLAPPAHTLSVEEAAARQASAETAEAQRLQRAEHANVVETLAGMFPDLDKDVISDVVYEKEGRVGLAVDACLALSN